MLLSAYMVSLEGFNLKLNGNYQFVLWNGAKPSESSAQCAVLRCQNQYTFCNVYVFFFICQTLALSHVYNLCYAMSLVLLYAIEFGYQNCGTKPKTRPEDTDTVPWYIVPKIV